MEKIVVSFSLTDGYTYWCDTEQAVYAESVEALYCELSDAAQARDHTVFEKYGLPMHAICNELEDGTVDFSCTIRTVDQWFEDTANKV